MTIKASDSAYMQLALEEARKCLPSDSAYSVGCVIVRGSEVISRGYSREIDPKIHAEESALSKVGGDALGCAIYSTMEPCSTRASRPDSCTQLIIRSQAARVVYGCEEPSYFVADCKGVETLRAAGIEVEQLKEFEDACLDVNKHLTKDPASLHL